LDNSRQNTRKSSRSIKHPILFCYLTIVSKADGFG
jgi:hypothetical protein